MEGAIDAIYFDGSVARRRQVSVRLGATLDIFENGTVIARWAPADIRRIDATADGTRYGCRSFNPTARLAIADPVAIAEIERAIPHPGADRPVIWKIVLWSALAACSLVLLTLFGMPWLAERMAPLVPAAVERKLGEAVDGQVRAMFGGKECQGPAGREALSILAAKLQERIRPHLPLDIRVLSSNIPNAVALPGGRIYVFEGLIARADDPDGLAGVIGHEMGHVVHRDSLRQLIRAGGSSFLLGLLFGDVTGAGAVILAGRQILDSAYSREAEMQADGAAAEAMLALGRSPAAMGKLLVKLAGDDQRGLPIFLRSHPYTSERAKALAALDKGTPGKPLLDDGQWQALKSICK